MELNDYQQEVIDDLKKYIQELNDTNDLKVAYAQYWKKKDNIDVNDPDNEMSLKPYDNTVKGVPRVMFKVPTAGGKTFIACNAIRTILNNWQPDAPKVVAWFVPSDSILEQTYKNLRNPQHPYNQKLSEHFQNRVVVVDKNAALQGSQIQPNDIADQLTIFVLSVQSFASNNKDGRRVYKENSNLASYEYGSLKDAATAITGADETSLISAIARLHPVVIIDESHNFGSPLRIELFEQIQPRFILDLTATPREKSNIISFVDAMRLKKAEMVKLPVILCNRSSVEEVIDESVNLRNSLDEKAKNQKGKYIRPILLLQAQPKSDKDNETFDKVKQKLKEKGIPEEEIAIKTATINELKGVNLMSEDCKIRYIITVNALKEGWDCPFAYILASLANKSSEVDVTQIVGRILRLPYAQKNADDLLNISYVFTASEKFRETIESVIKGLEGAGFTSKEVREANPEPETFLENKEQPTKNNVKPYGVIKPSVTIVSEPPISYGNGTYILRGFKSNTQSDDESVKESDNEVVETSEETENQETTTAQDSTSLKEKQSTEESDNEAVVTSENTEEHQSDNSTKTIENQALEESKKYDEEMKYGTNFYPIKPEFKDIVKELSLPIFMIESPNGTALNFSGTTNEKNELDYIKLTPEALIDSNWDLAKEDQNINFKSSNIEMQSVDVNEANAEKPISVSISDEKKAELKKYFIELAPEAKKSSFISQIINRIEKSDRTFQSITSSKIETYLSGVFSDYDESDIVDFHSKILQVTEEVKNKIKSLADERRKSNFKNWIETDKIICLGGYKFPERISNEKEKIVGIGKGLYTEEVGSINDFEYKVIHAVSELENVTFWHRNPTNPTTGFALNGPFNHYPDFIIRTNKGKIILLETKGDDRDNSDSKKKLDLGQTWEKHAGTQNFRYYMVFDKNETVEGSRTMDDFLSLLKQL